MKDTHPIVTLSMILGSYPCPIINSVEPPVADGSALVFAELINTAGIMKQSELRPEIIIDKVYAVQHDAFLALQAFGEDVKLPRKKKGHLVKDINKKILKTRNSITGESFTIDDFILAFKEKYPEEYDIYTFEKKGKLKEWLENVLNSLPKS